MFGFRLVSVIVFLGGEGAGDYFRACATRCLRIVKRSRVRSRYIYPDLPLFSNSPIPQVQSLRALAKSLSRIPRYRRLPPFAVRLPSVTSFPPGMLLCSFVAMGHARGILFHPLTPNPLDGIENCPCVEVLTSRIGVGR